MRPFGYLGVLLSLAIGGFSAVEAATWSRTYIRQLPDSAFAIVETPAKGRPVRHLPHHDAQGALDVPHLCNALARLSQVNWSDPGSAAIARRHLRGHLAQLGGSPCRPGKAGR